MTTIPSATPIPTTAPPWPADPAASTAALPPGVPLARWAKAVELVRTEASTAAGYWSLWCIAYKRYLRGHGNGAVFSALFNEYEASGGRGSPFDPAGHAIAGPTVPAGERAVVDATSDTIGQQAVAGASQEPPPAPVRVLLRT